MSRDLFRLERVARCHGAGIAAAKRALLASLDRRVLRTADQVLRLHEVLCWLRAYPDDAAVLAQVERMLDRFARRSDLRRHRDALADSGIASTAIRYRFYWPVALWLARRWGERLHLAWDDEEVEARLCRALPLLEGGAKRSIDRLRGPSTDAAFLVERIAALPGSTFTREALHDGIDAGYRLEPGPDTPSRTTARHSRSVTAFRSTAPDRARPDLLREMRRRPRAVRAVSAAEGRQLVDLALGAMVTRSRDLEAFGYRDPRDVRIVDDGSGLEFALIGVVPERRFLLHATYGILTLQSGVPIGYAQADALLGSVGLSYNTFETFRGGEAARVFGRLCAALHHVLGAEAFSVEPYQLGLGNEEGVASGAWWFYYKMGFRPCDHEVQRIVARELARMERDPEHRSTRATLVRLAAAHLFFESDTARGPRVPTPPWGIAGVEVAKGPATSAVEEAARLLGVHSWAGWSPAERHAFERWAPFVKKLRGIERWSTAEKRAAAKVIRAKGGRRESTFVARLDAHPRLGKALLELERSGYGDWLKSTTIVK